VSDWRSGTNGWGKGTWQFPGDLKASQPSESKIGVGISVDELSLLLFEIDELDQLIEEKAAEQDEVACRAHTWCYWHKTRETDADCAHHQSSVRSGMSEVGCRCGVLPVAAIRTDSPAAASSEGVAARC
jgi:hypothetical protein